MYSFSIRRNHMILVLIGLLALAAIFALVNRATANYTWGASGIPIHYQGRLVDPQTGQNMPDGTYSMTFRLYQNESGPTSSAIDSETKNVAVHQGVFAVELDFGDSLYSITPYETAAGHMRINGNYLGISVGGDPEMTPRQKLHYAPLAMAALDSLRVQGFTPVELMAGRNISSCSYKLTNMNDFTGSSSTTLTALKYTQLNSGTSCDDLEVLNDGTIRSNGSMWITLTVDYTAIPTGALPGGYMELQIRHPGGNALSSSAAGPTASGSFTKISGTYSGRLQSGDQIQFVARPSGIGGLNIGDNSFHTLNIVVTRIQS